MGSFLQAMRAPGILPGLIIAAFVAVPASSCDFHDMGMGFMGFGSPYGMDHRGAVPPPTGEPVPAAASADTPVSASERMARMRADLLARTPGLAAVRADAGAPLPATSGAPPSR